VTELQQNRYDQLLRRVGDLKGPGSKVNDVLQELFPTIDVENVPGELLLLMGTRIGFAATFKAPTAGKKPAIQLFNPEGSGQLITISSMLVSGNSSSEYFYNLTSTALATNTGIPRLRDARNGTNAPGVAELRTSPDAVQSAGIIFRLLTSTTITLEDKNSIAVLSPGTGLIVVADADVGISVAFNYRERVAEPSELSF